MQEQSLFDFPTFQIDKKIRLIELFGGIGSQAMALRDLGVDFETYKLVEFDKYAIKSYNKIHGTNFETLDIRNVKGVDLEIRERERYCYIMTYSFPCTDLSVAGKMKGMSKEDWKNGQSTRSGLLWEVERIINELPKEELPDVLLMENVPQVHAEKNEAEFDSWLEFLRSKGYQSFTRDLNAKDYGIPQNRDRCFCVSLLGEEFLDFQFPEEMDLNYVMRDFLETEVDEKYYVNSEKAKELISKLIIDGTLPTEGGGGSQLSADRENGCRSCEDTLCERLQGIRHGLGHNERCLSKKKRPIELCREHTGGADTTRICGECLPEQRTFPDNSCKRLQNPVINNKSVILGVIDPEGYDKENRVYSGGGVLSYPISWKRASKSGGAK